MKAIAQLWDDSIVPAITEYIRIPAKSPHFDRDWQAHGHIEAALQRSFLGRLPRDLVDRLVEDQLRMDVPADTMIYREGEASRAFLIISGLVPTLPGLR